MNHGPTVTDRRSCSACGHSWWATADLNGERAAVVRTRLRAEARSCPRCGAVERGQAMPLPLPGVRTPEEGRAAIVHFLETTNEPWTPASRLFGWMRSNGWSKATSHLDVAELARAGRVLRRTTDAERTTGRGYEYAAPTRVS